MEHGFGDTKHVAYIIEHKTRAAMEYGLNFLFCILNQVEDGRIGMDD